MQTTCHHGNHVWTVESRSRSLHPGLDLIPGRLCLCGQKVIVDHPGPPFNAHSFRVEAIDGLAAEAFARDHPNLVVWQ